MADIQGIIDKYAEVCRELGATRSHLVMRVLKKEVKIQRKYPTTSVRLYLAGNNKLVVDSEAILRLDDLDMVLLYKTLCEDPCVVSLDLRYNHITDDGCKYLGLLLAETTTLKELNLMGNFLTDDGARYITKGLYNNSSLLSLQASCNEMGNIGGMYFAECIQLNGTLRELDIGDTDLGTESAIAIATVLNFNKSLKALNVNRPILTSCQEETTVHYARMLVMNSNLEELHMMKHDMTDFGCDRLMESLKDNFCLTYLNIGCNRITRDGAKSIAKLLKQNTPLKILDIGFNRIGNDGALLIADALSGLNTNLTTLVLVSNEIRGKGLCSLAECLSTNTTLSNIYIWGNDHEESACLAFAKLIDRGRILLENTDVKPYVVDGINYLAEQSHGLRKWYYWGPTYGSQAQPDLAKFVRGQPSG
ncbi:hypothetical protein NP493_122g02020 [Ridgeia piscesae]|uniref:Leucine-rich repeat-containing protein 34 n=1 Tax=Ridgeia piscesae TaxID=27915 RepID=A0AAD9UGU4_RIDPI|nr:hypothetical protein NP493_122g02020 [Ridgeia piscesae]